MFKFQISLIFLFISTLSFGQEWKWEKLYELPLDSGVSWNIDVSKQAYIFQKQSITKYTSQGKKSLVQSFKSIGDISSIDANNQLKIAVFSEEQQTVCFLDNALASTTDCINLSDFNIQWANLFATSNQTDRFWIFDQVNNELKLLTTGEQQQQVIQNLKQVSDLGTPIMLFERNNNLFIIDDKNQLAEFDIFGTLVNTFSLDGYSKFFSNENNIFGIKDNQLFSLFSFEENMPKAQTILSIPDELQVSLVSIQCTGDYFFFCTKTQLSAYQIKKK